MEEKYLFTIIAIIIILIVSILLVRFKTKQNNQKIRNSFSNKKNLKPIYTSSAKKEQEKNSVTPIPTEKTVLQTPTKTLTFSKRIVPSHEKITKESFKEFSGVDILVAEDNIINQKVIKGLLADTGIKLYMANDGQEALDLLQKNSHIFMILMDAHMPNVDGFEATRIIRSISKYDKIPIVALSGDIAPDDIKKMKESGMQEHLEKPLKISKLYDILYAYNIEDSLDKTSKLLDLNIKHGLEVCGNDEKFYKELLYDFTKTYQNSAHQLGVYLYSYKLKEADAFLLDIIGISANLGADSLYVIANEIKVALKNSEKKSYIAFVEKYKVQLDKLIHEIKVYGI